tara:strand:+ start:529 stop:1653 length:1125 start_codon:yes stop_codon:yes gene_type:complete
MSLKTILFVTGSRSEYGLMKNLISMLSKKKDLKCHVLITGNHLSKKYGNTSKLIKKDKIIKYSLIDIKVGHSKSLNIINSMSIGLIKFNKLFNKIKPDKVILVGDRFETYIAAVASRINNLELIHFHGGETTTGAYDDYWRHSITIMSDKHFVANSKYLKRVTQLKNSSKYIYNVGGLGIENTKNMKFYSRDDLQQKFNFSFNKNNVLVVYHSETVSPNQNKKNFIKIINACKKVKETNFFISYPGYDLGSDDIITEIKKLSKSKMKNLISFKNLGENGFLSLLKICDCILGNSSSGIIEAPYLSTPTINLGLRQNGRVKDVSIFDCDIISSDIEKKINYINNLKNTKKTFKSKRIYGNGNASEKASKIIYNGK